MYNELILNASLLVALSSLYNLLARVRKDSEIWVKILAGLVFGGVAIAGMKIPFHYAPGVIYDGRSIVLAMAGLFGGGVTTLVSILVAGIFRASLGGPGVWAGLATILFCGLIGLAFRRLHKNLPGNLNLLDLYVLGIVAHLVMLVCQLLILPIPIGLTVISKIWPAILLIFPVATVLMGLLLRTEERNLLAYEEIRTSNELYRDLVETSQDLIWQCDIDGRYTFLNPAWEEVFGYKIEEMLGKKFSDFQTSEYAEQDKQEFARLLQGNTVKGLETVHIGKDGREIHLVFNAKFLVDAHGMPAGTRGTAYDSTERKRSEAALLASEKRFRSIVENSDAGYFSIGKDGIIQDVNDAWVRLYRFGSREEIIGQHFAIIQKIDDLDQAIEFVEGIMRGDSQYQTGEFSRRCKDGTIGYHTFSARPVLQTGQPVGIEGFIIDTTEMRHSTQKLQESEKRFHLLFDAMVEGVALHTLVFDESGKPVNYRIVDVNPQFERILSIKKEDISGKLATDAFNLAEPPYAKDYFRVTLKKENFSFETYFPPLKKHFLISATPWGETGFATIFEDITERKMTEERIRQLNASLELRVAERTNELESKNRELESFSYSVSHDLRAPLRAISGFAEIINRRYRPELNEQAQHYFDNIVAASSRMGHLIDDLLSYSRLGRQAINRSSVNVNEVLSQVVEDLNGHIKELNALVEIEPDLPEVTGNKTLFQQIFVNLLDNALAYHRPDVPPRIQVSGSLEKGMVTYRVSDNGLGIAPEFQEKVFNVFQRLHSDEFYPGTGIGLAIVKKAIELQGGKIRLDSETGQGSIFTIQFPEENQNA